MSTTEPTRDELADAADELVRLWHRRAQINPARDLDRYHDARLVCVSGLGAHAYRTGEVGGRLLRGGLWLESAPIIRTSFECAVTAQWAAQVPDGVQAILNEDYRSRRNMADLLWQSPAQLTDGAMMPNPEDEDHESSSTAQARRFNQMCDDLEGGATLYSYYRTLCWFSHPTNYVIDSYTNDAFPPLRLRREPRTDDETAYVFRYFGVMALVLAASALDHLDAEKVHLSDIARVAQGVGMPALLPLTAAANVRTAAPES